MGKKLYYKIGEVVKILGVPHSTLRFWEDKFPEAMPKKNDAGTRSYTEENLNDFRLIKHLLKEKGMTIEGARQRMRENKSGALHNLEIIEKLQAIRAEIAQLKESFDSISKEQQEEESEA